MKEGHNDKKKKDCWYKNSGGRIGKKASNKKQERYD